MDAPKTSPDDMPPEADSAALPELTEVEGREVMAYMLLLRACLLIADEAYKLPEGDERRDLLAALAVDIREKADYIWNCIDAKARQRWFLAVDAEHGILGEPRLGQSPRRKLPPTNSLTERQLQFIQDYGQRHRQLWFLYYVAEAGFGSVDAFYSAPGPMETDRYGVNRPMTGPSRTKIDHWIKTGEINSTVMVKLTRKMKAHIPEGLFYLTDIPSSVLVDGDVEGLSDGDGQGERDED